MSETFISIDQPKRAMSYVRQQGEEFEQNTQLSKLPLNSLNLDPERYYDLLKEIELTENQKQEFLQTLWNIIVGFSDMGWGIEPTQTVCDTLINEGFDVASEGKNSLNSGHEVISEMIKKHTDETAIGVLIL